MFDTVNNTVSADPSAQVGRAREVIERHLASTLLSIHVYGSAMHGGLRRDSDIDLLVTVSARLADSVREALILDLLEVSALAGQRGTLRPLEVTVVVHGDIVPWRWPARRELQFGEWLREDFLAGIFEPAAIDSDLAILLSEARLHSAALTGRIAPKHIAADWVLERLPVELQAVLLEARQAYLGLGEDRLASHPDEVTEFIRFARVESARWLP